MIDDPPRGSRSPACSIGAPEEGSQSWRSGGPERITITAMPGVTPIFQLPGTFEPMEEQPAPIEQAGRRFPSPVSRERETAPLGGLRAR